MALRIGATFMKLGLAPATRKILIGFFMPIALRIILFRTFAIEMDQYLGLNCGLKIHILSFNYSSATSVPKDQAQTKKWKKQRKINETNLLIELNLKKNILFVKQFYYLIFT
ncbi:MAG TPA: hypothetical protein VGB38_06600 [bacterium]